MFKLKLKFQAKNNPRVVFCYIVDKFQFFLLSTVCPPWGCVCGCRQVPLGAKKCFSWYKKYAKWGKKCQLVPVCFEKCFGCGIIN